MIRSSFFETFKTPLLELNLKTSFLKSKISKSTCALASVAWPHKLISISDFQHQKDFVLIFNEAYWPILDKYAV